MKNVDLCGQLKSLAAYPPWPDAFPRQLAIHGELIFLQPLSLDLTSYGTARMMLGRYDGPHDVMAEIKPTTGCFTQPIVVEYLSHVLTSQFSHIGLSFLDRKYHANSLIFDTLSVAFNHHLAIVPSLCSSVQYLVRAVHLLEAESDEYDVSYSTPAIPFSIFLSVPRSQTPTASLRVVEAVIHETMHVQLSLFEHCMPLIERNSTGFKTYSPWKGAKREAGGILHALYVFRVIERFWKKVAAVATDTYTVEFAITRCEQIRSEIQQVSDFASCPMLTEGGRELVRHLLRDHN